MTHSKELLQLQFDFAQKVSLLSNKPLEECLLHYTSFYKIFIPDWDFNPNNQLWIIFLDKFKRSGYEIDVLNEFKLDRENAVSDQYGCFSYHYNESQKTIYIHFKNTGEKEGVLSKERIDSRLKELKDMFNFIKEKYPEAENVSGFSWLYNIEAYNRLFPVEYIKTAKEKKGWFKSLALWGQFLNNKGEGKTELSESFRSKLEGLTDIDHLDSVFPYKTLQPKADIQYFYKFYEI